GGKTPATSIQNLPGTACGRHSCRCLNGNLIPPLLKVSANSPRLRAAKKTTGRTKFPGGWELPSTGRSPNGPKKVNKDSYSCGLSTLCFRNACDSPARS